MESSSEPEKHLYSRVSSCNELSLLRSDNSKKLHVEDMMSLASGWMTIDSILVSLTPLYDYCYYSLRPAVTQHNQHVLSCPIITVVMTVLERMKVMSRTIKVQTGRKRLQKNREGPKINQEQSSCLC